MNRQYHFLLITTVLAAALSVAAAQSGNDISQHRMFGKGHPFFVGDLPPGRTREKLESLPAPARRRAMDWLHSFAFPAKDVDVLIFDGHVVSATAWNGGSTLYARPYDTDGDPSAFSQTERGAGGVAYVNVWGRTGGSKYKATIIRHS